MYSQQASQKVKESQNNLSFPKSTHWNATMASSTVSFGSLDAPLFLPFFFFPEAFFFPDFFLGGIIMYYVCLRTSWKKEICLRKS